MTALTIHVPRMTRVTWHRHRAAVLGIVVLFLGAAALLFIDGVAQRHWVDSHHLTRCLASADAYGISRCESYSVTWAEFLNNGRTIANMATAWSVPALVGLSAGVPWVTREFESGAFRFTWAQSVSPGRWLLGTFGPLTLLAGACAALYGLAALWWHQVAQWRTGSAVTPWDWGSFELTPLSLVSWTLLGMALALFLGVTIRRVVPAVLAFTATATACVAATEAWLQPHLFAIGTTIRQFRFRGNGPSGPGWGSHVTQDWFRMPDGHRLPGYALSSQINWRDADRWLTQHHITYWVAYQPHRHLVWFELARNGLLLLVAALLVVAALWWLRRRPAE